MNTIKPMLKKRPGSRHQKERDSYGHHKEQNNHHHWILIAIRLPFLSRSNWEKNQRTGQQSQMHEHLMPGREMAHEKVCVCISTKEENLENKHAGGPDRRSSAKPRKDVSSNNWFDLKEQKGTEKDRQGKGEY